MHFYKFDNVFLVPAPDTIRRRAQERFHHQKEMYWKQVAKRLGWANPLFLQGNEEECAAQLKEWKAREEAWRETDEAKLLFEQLAKGDIYLPTAKTINKRKILEVEYRKEFGVQTSLG